MSNESAPGIWVLARRSDSGAWSPFGLFLSEKDAEAHRSLFVSGTRDYKVFRYGSVYGVFDNDGYECSNLVGVFGDSGAAERVAQRIRELYVASYQSREFKWAGSVEVREMSLGAYKLPPECEYYLETKGAVHE